MGTVTFSGLAEKGTVPSSCSKLPPQVAAPFDVSLMTGGVPDGSIH